MKLFIDYINNYQVLLTVEGALIFLMCQTKNTHYRVDYKVRLLVELLFLASILDTIDLQCTQNSQYYIRWFCSLVCYCIRPVSILLLDQIVYPDEKRSWTYYAPTIFILIFILTSPIHHLMYYYYQHPYDGLIFKNGNLTILYTIVLTLNGVIIIRHAFENKNCVLKTRKFLTLFFVFMCFWSLVIGRLGIGFSQYFNIAAAIIPINYLYLYYQASNQIIENQGLQIRQKRQELTLSQIRPHFLYNTLATIRFLIRTDPDLSIEVLEHFAAFLRSDLDAAELESPISIKREFQTAQDFSEIEMVRFSNIDVSFQLEDSDYLIPALSVQTLVENAIHHGVNYMKEGLVTVNAWGTSDYHIVTISDNGGGFDPENAEYHFGIRMVEERLKEMVNGELIIDSQPGTGTIFTIKIPKKNDSSDEIKIIAGKISPPCI